MRIFLSKLLAFMLITSYSFPNYIFALDGSPPGSGDNIPITNTGDIQVEASIDAMISNEKSNPSASGTGDIIISTGASTTTGEDILSISEEPTSINTGETLLSAGADNQSLSGNNGQSGQILDISSSEIDNSTIQDIYSPDKGGKRGSIQNLKEIMPSSLLISPALQLNSGATIPSLIISEVYFDGTDERIEIYNNSSTNFSGDLSILGAKASTITLSNVSIPSESLIIVGDNLAMIPDQSFTAKSGLSLNLYDTKQINIDLIFSGTTMDSFYVNTGDVQKINDNKASFHRYTDTNTITGSNIGLNYNISSPYIASPGIVYQENNVPFQAPELRITEVYHDDRDERFEITNIANFTFDGDLTLSGIGSGNVVLTGVTILPGSSVVFANNYDLFQTTGDIFLLSPPIDIPDTEQIDIELIRSGASLDTFIVDQTWVEYYDDAMTSFEKVGSLDTRMTTVVGLNLDRFYNIQRGYAANPTTYFNTGENMIDVSIPRETETVYTGNLPINCDDRRDTTTAEIVETYYGSGIYQPFVELKILDEIADYYDYIVLSGSATSGQLWFDIINADIDVEKNKNILLSNSEFRYWEGLDSIYNPYFTLNNSGRITLYGYSAYDDALEILDVVYLEGGMPGKSLYYNAIDNSCARVFDLVEKFSPGFDRKLLDYFPINDEPKIVYEYISSGGGGGCSSSSIDFNTSQSMNREIQISTIKRLEQDNGETLHILKLKNKTNQDVSLRDYSLQILIGDKTSTTIKGNTLFTDSTMSFVGDYFLQNKNSCVNLMKGNQVIDRYCYRSLSKATEKDIANIQQGLDFRIEETTPTQEPEPETNTGSLIIDPLPESKISISILDIDYNPAGSDTNNETITLKYNSVEKLNLSDLKIQVFKDEKSYSPKRLTSEDIYIYQGQALPIKGNFSFPNSAESGEITVNLLYNNQILTDYSYDPSPTIPGKYTVKTVYDGDTFSIDFNGETQKVRLLGIDAPESTITRYGYVECYGKEAKEYLKNKIDDQEVYISFDDNTPKKDSYGRWLAYAYLDNESMNEDMIENGLAFEYTHNSQKYSLQSSFQKQESIAKSSKIGLRDPNTCNGSKTFGLEQEDLIEDTTSQDYFDYEIQISNVDYKPDGENQESITLELLQGDFVNLGNDFYMMVNNTKRNLTGYGILKKNESKVLIGNFSFPNTKASCIKLMRNDTNFDMYCYDPKLEKLEFTGSLVDTGILIATGMDIIGSGLVSEGSSALLNPLTTFDKGAILMSSLGIISIIPNPIGSDKDNETIIIFFEGNKDAFLENKPYLLIGTRKKYLNPDDLVNGKQNTIKGNFSFPNKATCISIGVADNIYDKFCYPEPKEGYKYIISNGVLESINTLDLGILSKAKLSNINNKVCLTYQDTIFSCKKMPYSKLSIQQVKENRLTKNFFNSLQNNLKLDRPIMYYNSNINKQFSLYFDLNRQLKDGQHTITLNQENYDINDFSTIYQNKYPKSLSQLVDNNLDKIIDEKIIKKTSSLYQEYLQKLDSKTHLKLS